MLERLLAKRHIRDLDLSSVREALVEKQDWTAENAERVEADYKRFLYALAHKRREDILSPPNREVDEFWHQHILDTRKYREDCDTVFGHYVDHTTALGPEEQRNADTRRRRIYEEFEIDSFDFNSEAGHSHSGSTDGCHDGGSAHGCDTGSGHGDGGSDGGGGDGGGGCGGK